MKTTPKLPKNRNFSFHSAFSGFIFCKPVLLFSFLLGVFTACQPGKKSPGPESYAELQQEILKGWNSWDTRSISSFVLLPEGLSYQLKIADTLSGDTLSLMFTGNRVSHSEKVTTIAHTPDGSYTDFTVRWRNFGLHIQSASEEEHLSLCITPVDSLPNPGYLLLNASMLFGKAGKTFAEGKGISAQLAGKNIFLQCLTSPAISSGEASMAFALREEVIFSTQAEADPASVKKLIQQKSEDYWKNIQSKGKSSEVYHVIQNALNWLVIYDPAKNRPLTPVARTWAYGWGNGQEGGYVLFCWDNFFASNMHSLESKELAFNEAIQMCREIDDCGFVPNFSAFSDVKSRDRSQPPVGSMMVLEIYKRHPEAWFLREVFDRLMIWNRWWPQYRDSAGYLCWGSHPAPTPNNDPREKEQNSYQAAAYESGLDNTPMYDGVKFDTASHLLLMADVGLMSLYVSDCNALAEIATILGRTAEAEELKARSKKYGEKLASLWSEEKGIFLNFDLSTQQASYRISPTNFYPLLAKVATQAQAERMMKEHFYNPEEFWGDYIMPSIARNDTAYTGKEYWRGSIWAPMNFLVYLGMRNYDLKEARKDLADKSAALLLKEWNRHGYIRENYDANTGTDPGSRSDHFYHWGALLGMIYYMENAQE